MISDAAGSLYQVFLRSSYKIVRTNAVAVCLKRCGFWMALEIRLLFDTAYKVIHMKR